MRMTLHKACFCHPATVSGPRFLCRGRLTDAAVLFTLTLVQMACDVCDTPWEAAA